MVRYFAWVVLQHSDTCKKFFFISKSITQEKWIYEVNRTNILIRQSLQNCVKIILVRIHFTKFHLYQENLDIVCTWKRIQCQVEIAIKENFLQIQFQILGKDQGTVWPFKKAFKVNSCAIDVLHCMSHNITLNSYCKIRDTLKQ